MNNRQRQIRKLFGLPSLSKMRSRYKKLSTYDIHEKSFNNFDAIQKSEKCACYFCGNFFDASEIEDWTSDNTAICPICFNDSIVQDYNVKITQKLLEKMNDEWFGGLRHVAGFGENAPKAHIIDID